MAEVSTSARLPCTAKALRTYLGVTANLPAISDPDLELEVLDAPEYVTEGSEIEFRISAYGFKQRMKHRYKSVADDQIVAEQIEGPTRAWTHIQTITSDGTDHCCLTDQIIFEPPGGMLGFVMTEDKIRESIHDGMEFRYDALNRLVTP